MANSTTQFSIIGLLTWRPMTGYDIRREIHDSIGHFWSESYGQIYPCLRRLVADGLAVVENKAGRGPGGRKVYHVTPAGRRALKRWLVQPIRPTPVRSELCLKLCFGSLAGVRASQRQVRAFRATHAERLATWKKSESQIRRILRQEPEAVHFLLTVRMGVAVARACVRWADESLEILSRHDRRRTRRRR